MSYTPSVINLNSAKDKYKNKKKRVSNGITKVSGFSYKRDNKLGTHLSWIMFHMIANTEYDSKKKGQDSPLISLGITETFR